jgi:hypothetical protein
MVGLKSPTGSFYLEFSYFEVSRLTQSLKYPY